MERIIRDIEESDELLEQDVEDSVSFWEKKQREVVTSVVDYNLQTLTDLVTDDTIDLSPQYQRRLRWDDKRQSQLIESFLMNVPVPPIFLNEDDYGSYSVIDGKQRLGAVSQFMLGHLRLRGLQVFAELNGATFFDLPGALQRVLKTRPTLRAIIILRQSDDDVKWNVFQRLNTGGVRLNAQEIRNSTHPGPMNDLIMELSAWPLFHKLLGIKHRTRSAIYQEMRDAEFVLRFFTFLDTWSTFQGGMKRQMDEFMGTNQFAGEEKLAELRSSFVDSVKGVEAAFGEYAFRRWVPERGQWRRQVLAALFDAQMFAVVGMAHDDLREGSTSIIERWQKMFSEDEFRRSIDAATNTPALFKYRIKATRETLMNREI